jgi:outer membrane murein-binding lipoprotein Lpp
VVLDSPPSIQYFNANGGWPQGDAGFTGPSRPNDASITYYQKARHMYGDLKLEIFDPGGSKLAEFTPKSKHKGLNRAQWSMRLPPPVVPPGAQILFPASEGPRVLPGTYPVKLLKGDQTYDGQVTLVLDPRARFNLDDRKAEYELAMKLYKMLGHMSYEVAAIQTVRDNASERAGRLGSNKALQARLEQLSANADGLRSKIVATKEGGAITGEERIREHVGELYGYVIQYEGRPTNYQVARADSLDHELQDVVANFDKLTADLPAINSSLQRAKLEPITVPKEEQWLQEHANRGEAPVKASATREID